jgi:hypothetical protein
MMVASLASVEAFPLKDFVILVNCRSQRTQNLCCGIPVFVVALVYRLLYNIKDHVTSKVYK